MRKPDPAAPPGRITVIRGGYGIESDAGPESP